MKPFNLEDFKNGQKALTRDGQVVTFVGIRTDGNVVCELPDGYLLSVTDNGFWWKNELPSSNDLVSMVSRHQSLIDAWHDGAVIEGRVTPYSDWIHLPSPLWHEDKEYRIKPEPVIHCLAYDAKRFNHESTTAVRARVVKKEVAQANGWTIIQEWEA